MLIFFLTSDHSKWSKSGLEDGSEIYRKTKLLLLNHSPGIWVCKLFQFAKLYSRNDRNNVCRFFRNPLTIKCSFWIGNFPNWHFRRTVELQWIHLDIDTKNAILTLLTNLWISFYNFDTLDSWFLDRIFDGNVIKLFSKFPNQELLSKRNRCLEKRSKPIQNPPGVPLLAKPERHTGSQAENWALRPLSIPTCDFVCFCKTDNFRSKMDKITVRTLGMVENMINHWNKMHTDALCAWLAVSGSLLADVRLPKKSSVKRKFSDPASGHWESANEKNKSQNLIPSTLIAKNYQLNEVSGHVLWFRVFRFWVGNDKFPIHKRKEEMTWCEKCFDIPKEGYHKCNSMHF